MAPPSVSWTAIPSSDLDPDSPITTELVTALFENGVFNNEWLGNKTYAQQNHRHQGLTTDGTDNVDASDITGTLPISYARAAATASEGVSTQTTFGTGALGFTPQKCVIFTYCWENVGGGGVEYRHSWAFLDSVTTSLYTHVEQGVAPPPAPNPPVGSGGYVAYLAPAGLAAAQLNCTQFASGGINFQWTRATGGVVGSARSSWVYLDVMGW